MSYKRFFFVVDFHHQRFSFFEFCKTILLLRLRDEFSTRVLRFFSFVKALFFTAIAYVSMSVFVLNVLLSIRFNFLFMFISFCLMSLSLMNSRKSSSSTILSMRKVVESLIVSEFFFQQSFYVFLHLLLAIL